jgi:hypothetical protein
MSDGAADLMRWLGEQYVEAGFPNHQAWNFTPADGDLGAAELRALGLLYFGGPHGGAWQLTASGVAWIMANRTSSHTAKPRPAPSRMRAPTKHLSLDGDAQASAAPPVSLASVPAMSADAVQMMEFVGGEYEKSRFPPVETWTIAGLLHEVKLKYELQAVGLLTVSDDGSCRLTATGKDWIMWRRKPGVSGVPVMTDLEAEVHITNGLEGIVNENFPAKPMQVYSHRNLAATLGVPEEKLGMLERIMSKNAHWGLTAKRDQGAVVLVFGSQGVREVAGDDDY